MSLIGNILETAVNCTTGICLSCINTVAECSLNSVFEYDGNSETATASQDTSAAEEEEIQVSEQEYKEDLNKLILDYNLNIKEGDSHYDEVLKSYINHKTIHKEWSDSAIADRLKYYIKALESHDTELHMGEYLNDAINGDENLFDKLTNCDIKIVNDEIANTKSNPSSQKFIDSLLGRGSGYVDLYDTNDDQKISYNEFEKFEEKDSGQKLTNEEKTVTKEYFNRLDKNSDGYIDDKEMASHMYAVARLFDGNKSTTEDITFKEWYAASAMIDDENVKRNYDYASDQLYNALKERADSE